MTREGMTPSGSLQFDLVFGGSAGLKSADSILEAVRDLVRSRLRSYGPQVRGIRVVVYPRVGATSEEAAYIDRLPQQRLDTSRAWLEIEYASLVASRIFSAERRLVWAQGVRFLLEEASWALRLARVSLVGSAGFVIETFMQNVNSVVMDLPVEDAGIQAMVRDARNRGGLYGSL